jgi:hypothetical protein
MPLAAVASAAAVDLDTMREKAEERAETIAVERTMLVTCLLFGIGRGRGGPRTGVGDVVHSVECFLGERRHHAILPALRSLRDRKFLAFDGLVVDCDTCEGDGEYIKGASSSTTPCDDCDGRGITASS